MQRAGTQGRELFHFENETNVIMPSLGKILIVDDSVADIVGPYHLLHHMGYEVQLVFDGNDAIKFLSEKSYDLLVLDLNMPHIDGHYVLQTLESMKKTPPIKVILYTGEQLSPEIDSFYKNLEIIDVWKKPLQVSQIAAKLKKVG